MHTFNVALHKITANACEFMEFNGLRASNWPEAVAEARRRANPEGLKVVSRHPRAAGSVKFETIHCKNVGSDF